MINLDDIVVYLFFPRSVDDVEILMNTTLDFVYEPGMIDVCARIGALPRGGLETSLDVTLSTVDGAKAGLYMVNYISRVFYDTL